MTIVEELIERLQKLVGVETETEVRKTTEWGDVPIQGVEYDAERKVVIIK